MRAALIVNPFASNVTESRLERVKRILGDEAEVRVLMTEGPGHAKELAELAASEADAVFAFGGDGLFNEVVNGAGNAVPFGFVPGGGKNVFPRALGLPTGPEAATRRLVESLRAGRTRRISLGRVNGRRFTFAAGVGFDGELVRRVDTLGRSADGRRPGDLRFVAEMMRMLADRRWRYEPVVEIAGFGRAAFAFVANTSPYTYAGGVPIRVAPEASFNSGLDLVAPVRVRPPDVPRLLAYGFLGRRASREVLYGHDLDRVEVACDTPMPLQADGEDLGDVDRAVFEAERDAVTVLA
ncbi:MAG: diacylglycerol kinase family protein [Gaiellaceae bacterium]